MLVCLGLSGCPGVDKPRQRAPATQETPQTQKTTRKQEKTSRISETKKTQPVEQTTPPAQETPAESEIATEVIEADSDPRREVEMDAAVLPAVWVYFSRDDVHGYRAVFLFGHREQVSKVHVSYVTPTAPVKFENRGYRGMSAEEKKLFASQELRLQLSFLFAGTLHCGSAKIKQANIVSAGDKMDKANSLQIALQEGSC